MAIIPLGNGKGVTWEPTTELLCTKCREVFDPATCLKSIFLVEDVAETHKFEGIRIIDYWYLHDTCRSIEQILKDMGANIRWRAHDMPFILGFLMEKDGYRRVYKNRNERTKWFKPGVYETLLEQWRATLRGLDSRVTETIDIETIPLEAVSTKVIPILASRQPLDQKPGWLAIRFSILQRDKYRCRLCGVAASDGDHVRLEVDHITARYNGGTDDQRNLWTLCFECNRGKGTQAI